MLMIYLHFFLQALDFEFVKEALCKGFGQSFKIRGKDDFNCILIGLIENEFLFDRRSLEDFVLALFEFLLKYRDDLELKGLARDLLIPLIHCKQIKLIERIIHLENFDVNMLSMPSSEGDYILFEAMRYSKIACIFSFIFKDS